MPRALQELPADDRHVVIAPTTHIEEGFFKFLCLLIESRAGDRTAANTELRTRRKVLPFLAQDRLEIGEYLILGQSERPAPLQHFGGKRLVWNHEQCRLFACIDRPTLSCHPMDLPGAFADPSFRFFDSPGLASRCARYRPVLGGWPKPFPGAGARGRPDAGGERGARARLARGGDLRSRTYTGRRRSDAEKREARDRLRENEIRYRKYLGFEILPVSGSRS